MTYSIKYCFYNDFLRSCDDSESEKKSRTCEQCHKDQTPAEAEWKCLDCRYRLCGTCRDMHLAIPMLRGNYSLFKIKITTYVALMLLHLNPMKTSLIDSNYKFTNLNDNFMHRDGKILIERCFIFVAS